MEFCAYCGAKIPKVAPLQKIFCTKCGQPGTMEMDFCAYCGAKMPVLSPSAPAQPTTPRRSRRRGDTRSLPKYRPMIHQQSASKTYQTDPTPTYTQPLPNAKPAVSQYAPAAPQPEQKNVTVVVQQETSQQYKDKWIAFLLCLFLGGIGAHKFYEGKTGVGALYLLLSVMGCFTVGITWFIVGILTLIDLIVLLFKPNPYQP